MNTTLPGVGHSELSQRVPLTLNGPDPRPTPTLLSRSNEHGSGAMVESIGRKWSQDNAIADLQLQVQALRERRCRHPHERQTQALPFFS